MSDVDENAVRTMAWRAIQEVNGLQRAKDFDLTAMLMRCGLAHGFNYDSLEAFKGEYRTPCFGFFRDKAHYAGMCRVRVEYRHFAAIMVQSTGVFKGTWVFMLDTDRSILTSRDTEAVESFQGLEGPELVEAVIRSALTEPAAPRRRASSEGKARRYKLTARYLWQSKAYLFVPLRCTDSRAFYYL